jgi:hypothetical protein
MRRATGAALLFRLLLLELRDEELPNWRGLAMICLL